MNLKLIAGSREKYTVNDDDVAEFESAIRSDERIQAVNPAGRYVSRAAYVATRMIRPLRSVARKYFKDDYLIVLMGLNTYRCSPFFFGSGKKFAYIFDAWPDNDSRIQEFVRLFHVESVFVSSSLSADRLAGSIDCCKFVWIPEGIDPSSYEFRPYEERSIDVLQIGRKYEAHHEQIISSLQRSGRMYLYEKVKGKVIFTSRKEFINGLSRSKISICVPSSITHPERSGDVETLTMRYLQSMASKCLVLGHAPREMISLFGYSPVIEIDKHDPAKQIELLLADYSTYIPLIEKNYAEVTSRHTWLHRWRQMAAHIFP